MNDQERQGPTNATAEATAQEQIDGVKNPYQVVPFAAPSEDDLFSFRAEMGPPPPDPAPPPPPKQGITAKTVTVSAIALVVLVAVLVVVILMRQDPPPRYIDLGTTSNDSAGLEVRLIAEWDEKAVYKLYIDPIGQEKLAGFTAVASDPPYPLSVTLRLRDSSGAPVCQKQILFPFRPLPAASAPGNSSPDQTVSPEDSHSALMPQKTTDGDSVQNVAGSDGKITEIVVEGDLICPAKFYKRLVAWDFSSNFPSVADQNHWITHEGDLVGAAKRQAAQARAKKAGPHFQSLPAPIEGDDVIVSDNPSKGMAVTRAGRVFLVGTNGVRGYAPGWQMFPAFIHFRCDKKALCTLTRSDSATALKAHLLK